MNKEITTLIRIVKELTKDDNLEIEYNSIYGYRLIRVNRPFTSESDLSQRFTKAEMVAFLRGILSVLHGEVEVK